MGMAESEVEQRIIMALAPTTILERNNSGELRDRNGTPVRYGLGNISKKHAVNMRSADYVGITTVIVTPEMVGKKIGIFTAIEVKKEDWNPNKKLDEHEQAQKNWLDWVVSRGGLAGFANSVAAAWKIVRS